MGKALVIKGADYSMNKVTTVTFGNIPCTSIEFTEDTITLKNFDETAVEYTKTPNNTTDNVTLSSSDENVVTIVNGKLKAVGIGTCIVTATCGECSDAVSVNVEIEYAGEWKGAYAANPNGKNYVADSKGNNQTYGRIAAKGGGILEATYYIMSSYDVTNESYKPMKLPKNTIKIKVTCSTPSALYSNPLLIFWMKDESSGDSQFPQSAKYLSSEENTEIKSLGTTTIDVPSGADIFYPQFRLQNDVSPETRTATEEAERIGISIEFLAA